MLCGEMKTTVLLLLTAIMVHDSICPFYCGIALKVCAHLLFPLWHLNLSQSSFFAGAFPTQRIQPSFSVSV